MGSREAVPTEVLSEAQAQEQHAASRNLSSGLQSARAACASHIVSQVVEFMSEPLVCLLEGEDQSTSFGLLCAFSSCCDSPSHGDVFDSTRPLMVQSRRRLADL